MSLANNIKFGVILFFANFFTLYRRLKVHLGKYSCSRLLDYFSNWCVKVTASFQFQLYDTFLLAFLTELRVKVYFKIT